MKRIILIITGVLLLIAAVLYFRSSSNNSPLTLLPTPTPTFLPTSSEESNIYQDEDISFRYPSNWEVSEKYCDDSGCFLSLSLEKNAQMNINISEGTNLQTGTHFESIESYLNEFYPDKTVLSSQPTADNRARINTIEENNNWVLIQLPSKKILSITFSDDGTERDSILNSIAILE